MPKPSDRHEARKQAASMLWAWGWYDLAEHVGSAQTDKPKHEARKPHPDTMAGKK